MLPSNIIYSYILQNIRTFHWYSIYSPSYNTIIMKSIEKELNIPADYSYLCITCGALADKKTFISKHREHKIIDRALLESLIEENKEDLINYFLNDQLKGRRAEIVDQLDKAIQRHELRGGAAIESVIGKTATLSATSLNSCFSILHRLSIGEGWAHDQERVAHII